MATAIGPRELIDQRIRKIICEHLGIPDDEAKAITSETLLRPERDDQGRTKLDSAPHLGADSLDIVELVMAAEEEFGIEIEDDDAQKAKTLGDLVSLIESKMP